VWVIEYRTSDLYVVFGLIIIELITKAFDAADLQNFSEKRKS